MGTRVHLLGTSRVAAGDHDVTLKPTVRDQVLAHLAFVREWVPRGRLIFLFWPDLPEAAARHNVRQVLKRIRRLEWLAGFEAAGDAVRWSVATDVDDLEAAIEGQRWEDLPGGADLMPGLERDAPVEFERWLSEERTRIRDRWVSAWLKAARAAASSGTPDVGARHLEPLLADDDGDRVLPTYMDLAVRAGDRAAALAAFDRVAARLRDDLGVDPPPRASQLAARLRSPAVRQPVSAGLVVGRRHEIGEIVGLLAQPRCRLLTLLGPGGIGKSTLAHLTLSRVATRYTDGAITVPLEAIPAAEGISSTIASSLGLRLDSRLDPVEQLVEAVRRRRLLLVLDNAEHMAEHMVVLSRLLRRCPHLTVIVTSRERLRLDEEWVYEVDGLAEDDAVDLFLHRCRRVARGAGASRAEALAVCRAVGHSPLGIELAVPWLRVLSAAELAGQISTDAGLLRDGVRDGIDRHRSIDVAMAHSWRLASDEERTAVEALSTFVAPYSRELAETAVGVTALVLRALVDKSMVQRRSPDRYASHPLVRQYAAARLAADVERRDAARHGHAEAVLGALVGNGSAELLDDAVAAWRYCVDSGHWDLLWPAVEQLVTLLDKSGRCGQGVDLLAAAVRGADEAGPAAVAAVRHGLALLLDRMGRHRDAVEQAERAVHAADQAADLRLRVLSLLGLAWARKTLDGDDAQYAISREALTVAEQVRDADLLAMVRNSLGCSAPTLTECRVHLQGAMELLTDASPPDLRSAVSGNLGLVSYCLGDIDSSRRLLDLAVAQARDAGQPAGIGRMLTNLAFVHGDLGELPAAVSLARQAEELLDRTEPPEYKAYTTLVAGEISRLIGDRDGARVRVVSATRLVSAVGNRSLLLRALRLYGELLLDEGDVDRGLAVLAAVMLGPTRQGDFTSEILNPRAWERRVAGLDAVRVSRAWEAGGQRTTEELAAEVVGSCG